ncbi:thioredoxin-dependent thiol peroxidase [Afipia sp. Root123D2]|uniref:thioredoxin-dependent thiol peroxidase n=1 Tax=Afipia sp. Root123D2 TaxID=1736436 RepID=UPI0009E9C321|nr:thioredoxin-dependent thiol peroxidase [Afipia sp. Root123D2]
MPKKTRKKTGNTPTTAESGRALRKASAKTPAGGTDAAKKTVDRKGAGKPAKKLTTKKAAIRKVGGLAEGDPAPAFLLPRDGGESVSLADYAGRKLVIFFYPRADTPGCTLEAMDFSRLADAFAASQTAVLGISADPVKAQNKFRDKHSLAVPLASDEEHQTLERFGVWGEKSMYGKIFMGIVRTTVLIDSDGTIARIWRNVRVPGHAGEVLAAARAL